MMERLEGDAPQQLQRLQYIDFCLFFLGRINRKSHMERFGISSAAATRDLSLYKDREPKNINYDKSQKEYEASKTFVPVYSHDAEKALKFLSESFFDQHGVSSKLCSRPAEINNPDISILSQITRAIYQEKPIKMKYYSLSSGETEREFVPFSLVDTGLRWHVRGYDRKKKQFRDFVINRVKRASVLSTLGIEPAERKDSDIQWNRIVEMEIVPHPDLKFPETIAHEYGMEQGVLKINIRAAVAGYFLRRWNVDCSREHSGSPYEYHLWLKNNLALYGIENIRLAPLYNAPE